jgi:uncharacterized protein (DUF2141 family)
MAEQREHYGSITVTVENLRNNRGYLRVSLYDRAAGFPTRPEGRVRDERVVIEDGRVAVTFDGLRRNRTYAVVALHDENDDGKLNTNLAGLPREGFGFSNVKAHPPGPQDFATAALLLDDEDISVQVEIRYIL